MPLSSSLDVVLENDDLVVIGGPSSIDISLGIGSQGTRGSKIFANSASPTTLSLDNFNTVFGYIPISGDVYISTQSGSNYGTFYMYSGSVWNTLLRISDLIDTFFISYPEYVIPNITISSIGSSTSSELAAIISDETGSGSLVFATSPTLTTPNIGVATGTSLSTTGSITASEASVGFARLATDGGGNLSIGRTDNVTSTPYIDFNSGATTVDYDVRIQASGGTGVVGNGVLTVTGSLITEASSTNHIGLRLPHGTAPTSLTNGDIWTTTLGLFVRIDGETIGPLGVAAAEDVIGISFLTMGA